MAKRRRLDPSPFLGAATPEREPDLSRAKGPGPGAPPGEEPAGAPSGIPGRRAPVAQLAGGAAAAAALDEVAAALGAAREEGRLVLRLPLGSVAEGHLARDRLRAEPGGRADRADLSRAKGAAPGAGPGPRASDPSEEAMAELRASLLARGQQAPIEVVELPPGPEDDPAAPRWGLLSGWRRLMALRALHAETGEARFATVLAFVRRPASAAEAYVAMVEENEIREGLSFWERARVVRRAVAAGAFADDAEALRALFAAASYARRSKIKSLMPVVEALEGALLFPEAIGERLGLRLARALAEDPGFAGWVRGVLAATRPATAQAEVDLLADLLGARDDAHLPPLTLTPTGALAGAPRALAGAGAARASRRAAPAPRSPGAATRTVGAFRLRAAEGRVEVAGPGVTPELVERLVAWLAAWR